MLGTRQRFLEQYGLSFWGISPPRFRGREREVELNGLGGETLMIRWQLNSQVVRQHWQNFVAVNSKLETYHFTSQLYSVPLCRGC